MQRTDDEQDGNKIDAGAVPKLASETLAAQSVRIDAISRAACTSAGYLESLQSGFYRARA